MAYVEAIGIMKYPYPARQVPDVQPCALRSTFRFSKEQVTEVLSGLLATGELTFESEGAVELALALYAQAEVDYPDCLHVALALQAGQPPLWTFDKAAARVAGARRLA